MHKNAGAEYECQRRPVEGENAKCASHIEIGEATGVVLCVIEDSCNEESRKDKEDVHADPTPGKWQVVIEKDDEEGDRTQTIERRVVGTPAGNGPWNSSNRIDVVKYLVKGGFPKRTPYLSPLGMPV